MPLDGYKVKSSEPQLTNVDVRLLGVGAGAPTKVYGKGITVARTGAGVYTLTFSESPGFYAGALFGLDATTPADVNNYSVVCTATSSTVITVNVYTEAGAAGDMPAASWLNLILRFKQTSVS